MLEVLAGRDVDRRRGPPVRPAEALLGDRRQRPQHGRRRRGADQAQRALLQVDRLRRHRGQEAHRPVERAADPRVRRRAGRRHRRRRRQGSRDLQGPQGDADRHRRRRRRALRCGGGGLRCRRSTRRWRSCCRRWSGTCSATRPRWRSTPRPARCARRARSSSRPSPPASDSDDDAAPRCGRQSPPTAERFVDGLRAGCTTATSRRPPPCGWPGCCATCERCAARGVPARHRASSARPASLIDDLDRALTRAIEELTRPVDAIKHQAKTVTVGISRSDEGVLDRALVQAVLAAGAGRDVLSYRTLKVLADLDPAVAEVVGFTRYRIEGDPTRDHHRRSRRPLASDVPSRVERNPHAGRHQAPRRQPSARCSSPAAAATAAR